MITVIDVTLGQKWEVHRGFRVNRNGQRFDVPKGSVLTVRTLPKGCDEVWVTWDGHRFRISQQSMKDHAHVLP